MHVHVLTYMRYSCPHHRRILGQETALNRAVPCDGHQRSGLPLKGSGLTLSVTKMSAARRDPRSGDDGGSVESEQGPVQPGLLSQTAMLEV